MTNPVTDYSQAIKDSRRKMMRETFNRVLKKRPELRYELAGVKVQTGAAVDLHSDENGYAAATDGKRLLLGRTWFEKLGELGREIVMAHELAHIGLRHPQRQVAAQKNSCRECRLIASDWLANAVLLSSGWNRAALMKIEGTQLPNTDEEKEAADSMSFEELSEWVHLKRHDGKKDDGEGDAPLPEFGVEGAEGTGKEGGKEGKSPGKSATGKAGGAGAGQGGAGASTEALSDLVIDEEELLRLIPPPDYVADSVENFLSNVLNSVAENKSRRPDRRLPATSSILYPFERGRIPRIAIAVDCSGSVTGNHDARKRIAQLAAQVNDVAEQYGAHAVDVIWGDIKAVDSPEPLQKIGGFRNVTKERSGRIWGDLGALTGGGTCGALALLKSAELGVDATVIVTDGDLGDWREVSTSAHDERQREGKYPQREGVLWVVGLPHAEYAESYKEKFAKAGIENTVIAAW